MNTKKSNRIFRFILCVVMLVGLMPASVFAYWEEPTAEGNTELETMVYDYTQPVGVTMQRITGNSVAEFGENGNLGDDFLFVIKSGDHYYAMKDVAASEEAYSAIPAVDVTDWVNADGSLTVPADTLGVAFWRYEERPDYELGMFINGREDYITYTEHYESADGDDDYYNDAERTYTAEFKIRTFEDGQWIFNPGYWSENEISGTLHFNGSWSYYYSKYNSTTMRYHLITDLRDNGIGGKEFYFRYLGTNVEYQGDEVEGYLYYAKCRHQGAIRHAEYDAPTCMLKGCEEYWYCENCNRYMKDESFSELYGEEMPIIPATGHDWGNEKCNNCARPVPVYSKVTNQAEFDALADDTMFILVTEYGGKYYVPDLAEVYLYMMDSDGDGYYDIHDVDENENGIPDYWEFDEGGQAGVYDYLEWDMDNDGDVDEDDYLEFHYMICDQHLTDMLYSNGSVNATEVKRNPDGTFSHDAVKSTIEFEMLDVYLAEDYDSDYHEHWTNGEMPYHTKCIKQFVIPNMFINAPSMRPIERMYQQRIYDFGDSSSWGVIFYDNRNDYYYYPDGDIANKTSPLPFLDICKDGSVAVFDTFDDIMWVYYDEGQLAQLRLRDYEGSISFVTGHAWELEGWEWVEDLETGEGYYDTKDTQACVYLYASQQTSHTCEFGDWKDNENGRTHTGTCGCGETQTENHGWDDSVETKAPNCTEEGVKTFTCSDCGATKTEPIDALDHDWSNWTDEGANATTDTHTRSCQREGCNKIEQAIHSWGTWTPDGDINHKKTCSVCSGTRTNSHNWDDGVVTTEPTEDVEGVKTYTCTVCGENKTEPVDKLEHVHSWSGWGQNDENTHIRSCCCNETQTEEHIFDEGVVINWATHIAPGEKWYTCEDCGYVKSETLPALEEHEWSTWAEQDVGEYKRICADCGAIETMTLDEEKPVNTTNNNNVANTNLTNTDIELIEKVLTDEEQSQVAEGAEVKIYLKVEDISNETPTEHKAEAEAKAGNDEIGMYLDIELFKQVGTNETQVKETKGAVTITITIPENLINTDASVTRTYKIIRVHEDENGNLITDVIEGIFNSEDNSFTFETDKFSTYALVYADTSVPNTPDSPQTDDDNDTFEEDEFDHHADNTASNTPNNPPTGDNSMMRLWVALLFISCFGVIATIVYSKRRAFTK